MRKKIVIDDAEYKRTKCKEDGLCFGCAGYKEDRICSQLPPCWVAGKNYIFVEVKVKEPLP